MVGLCLFITFISTAKTAELIDMLFWGLSQVGQMNYVLDGGADPPR